jgi:hypothetical protein
VICGPHPNITFAIEESRGEMLREVVPKFDTAALLQETSATFVPRSTSYSIQGQNDTVFNPYVDNCTLEMAEILKFKSTCP